MRLEQGSLVLLLVRLLTRPQKNHKIKPYRLPPRKPNLRPVTARETKPIVLVTENNLVGVKPANIPNPREKLVLEPIIAVVPNAEAPTEPHQVVDEPKEKAVDVENDKNQPPPA